MLVFFSKSFYAPGFKARVLKFAYFSVIHFIIWGLTPPHCDWFLRKSCLDYLWKYIKAIFLLSEYNISFVSFFICMDGESFFC